jgi:protein-S-isoprenylcysteine O-methyltransferase Ste14
MTHLEATQPQAKQQVPDTLRRIGGWLFRHRTLIPQPIVLLLLLIPAGADPSGRLLAAGALVVAVGELLRLWAVRHIGAISRTRSERLGPLIATGPFRLVRNPLYIGNVLVWVGFAISANLLFLVPLILALLAFEYHAIVRWEEGLLESRLGDSYRAYAAQVPRWIPRGRPIAPVVSSEAASRFSWAETLFSERGTLIAIAAGYLLLWLKRTFQ